MLKFYENGQVLTFCRLSSIGWESFCRAKKAFEKKSVVDNKVPVMCNPNADRRMVLQSGWSERGDHFAPLGFPMLALLTIRKPGGLLRSSTCSKSRQQDVAGSWPVGGDRASELEITSSFQCGRCLLVWSSPCLLPAHGTGFNVKK